MSRWRKRPVVIEAEQLTGDVGDGIRIARWIESNGGQAVEPFRRTAEHALSIMTLEGEMKAGVGDWIIRGVQGEFYPCKPGVFAATYEPAGDGE